MVVVNPLPLPLHTHIQHGEITQNTLCRLCVGVCEANALVLTFDAVMHVQIVTPDRDSDLEPMHLTVEYMMRTQAVATLQAL